MWETHFRAGARAWKSLGRGGQSEERGEGDRGPRGGSGAEGDGNLPATRRRSRARGHPDSRPVRTEESEPAGLPTSEQAQLSTHLPPQPGLAPRGGNRTWRLPVATAERPRRHKRPVKPPQHLPPVEDEGPKTPRSPAPAGLPGPAHRPGANERRAGPVPRIARRRRLCGNSQSQTGIQTTLVNRR